MVTCKACKKNFHKKKTANMAQHGGNALSVRRLSLSQDGLL